MSPCKRGLATVVGLVLAGAGLAQPAVSAAESPAVPPAVATSARTAADSGKSVLEIRSSTAGLTAPTTAAPGPTTFHVTSSDPASGWVSLVRPRSGVTFEQFRAVMLKIINHVSGDVVEGSAELEGTAELLGGTTMHPDLPATFTQDLSPGTYWFFDYQNIRETDARHSTLTVSGPAAGRRPVPTATFTARLVDGQPRWRQEGTVRAGRPLRFTNAMPAHQNVEAIFFPLAAGATEDDVRAYVDRFGPSGEFPTEPLPTDPVDLNEGTGGLPMVSGRSSELTLRLHPGRYLLVDFFNDAQDGSSYLKRGHWKILDVV
ncbi:hypothetical protein [Streptomyces sp. NPDC008150]|uniref:hypothetical protein n=1 Tax=Streptomyces sp. NPDC008150 TaxID=3364816 RepID=UPI0036E7AD22